MDWMYNFILMFCLYFVLFLGYRPGKLKILHTPPIFNAPIEGDPLEFSHSIWCEKPKKIRLLVSEKAYNV